MKPLEQPLSSDFKTPLPENLMTVADNKFYASASDVNNERSLVADRDGAAYSPVNVVCLLVAGNDPDFNTGLLVNQRGNGPSVFSIAKGTCAKSEYTLDGFFFDSGLKMFQGLQGPDDSFVRNDALVNSAHTNFCCQPFPPGNTVAAAIPFRHQQMKSIRSLINYCNLIIHMVYMLAAGNFSRRPHRLTQRNNH